MGYLFQRRVRSIYRLSLIGGNLWYSYKGTTFTKVGTGLDVMGIQSYI